ncbi:MAG: hypothetical protein ACK595_00195, partial [Planctomycetota bacterium]
MPPVADSAVAVDSAGAAGGAPVAPRAIADLWPVAPVAAVARGRRAMLVVLALWAVAVLAGVPMGIGGGWRECDTQAIARNLAFEDFDLLRPRVDWRGDSDGAVECEFPLYQAAIALALRAFGESEVPGRLLSLASSLVAAWALHRLIEARAGPACAFVGGCAFLSGGHAFLL